MHRTIRTEPLGAETARLPVTDMPIAARTPSPESVAAYAAEVKALTNYEVWKRVESMILTLVPGQEADSDDWWRFRVLLDELQWRLSGLEGAGTVPTPLRLAA